MSEQRIRFVLRASSGQEEMAGLCREFGISRPTGYHWRKRFQETGQITELAERSRRPVNSPTKTAAHIEDRILVQRKQRPDWGARKLRVLLAAEGVSKPTSTIHRILRRNGLVHPHHQHPPALKRFEREQPNQLWQMDFKGLAEHLAHKCAPLSILDDCSRYAVELAALEGTKAQPVRQLLERTFRENGVPDAMLVDHGTPWWNANHPWGWTRLSIWLMRQGIRLHFSAVRHPQTQGKVERFHRSVEDALYERGFPQTGAEWPAWLQAFRHEYNQIRPHEALGMATPASRWRPSSKAFQETPPGWEYPAHTETRQVRASGQVLISNHEYSITGALAGETVAMERLSEDRLLVFYRATCIREINLAKRQSYPVYFSREQPVFEPEP